MLFYIGSYFYILNNNANKYGTWLWIRLNHSCSHSFWITWRPKKQFRCSWTIWDDRWPDVRHQSHANLGDFNAATPPNPVQQKGRHTHNIIGLIQPLPAYTTWYGADFVKSPRVGAYDAAIDDNATAVVRTYTEAAHKAKRADREPYEMEWRETAQVILAVVKDTWVQELQDTETFILTLHQKSFLPTSKRGAQVAMPLASWRCIMIFSTITSK